MTNKASATPSSQPVLFGRYSVSELLGETRLAAVYAASDARLQRRVLLHLLRKDLVGQERARVRFVAEVGQMARRSHQALLEVFDSGEAGGRPFMVTEHCGGRPLCGLGLLTVEQALLYLRQVASAVAACQSQRGSEAPLGLYHPPISSSNVLLVDEGRVKLVDSWLLPAAEALGDLAHYRAPELSEGRAASPAAAVYALGLLLFELITGERPISGADARATALAHLTARIPSLHQARPGLYLPTAQGLLDRATARVPEQRFPDARAFGEALDGLWRDLGAATQRLGPTTGRARGAAAPRPDAMPGSVAPRPDVMPGSMAPRPDMMLGSAPVDEPAAAPRPPAGPGHDEASPSVRRGPAQRGGMAGRLGRRGIDPAALRRRTLTRNLVGWLVIVGLTLTVALASYLAVNALADQVGGLPRPSVPGLPELPGGDSDPLGWLGGLLGGNEEVYVVNIAEGLNLRSAPDAGDPANVIVVVPNGMPVRKLEGPRVEGNIPWLRVRADVDGQQVEGWMSLNYLRPKE